MPGSKKNKVKKQSPDLPPSPALNQGDDNDALVDDLLAQLDSRDQTLQLNDLTISDSATTPVQKQDVKSRFKARQVLKLGSLQAKFLINVQIVGKEGCSTCPILL